jgi:hemerythrin superfamily protein
MKRSQFLQPLSKDHHAALVLAKACQSAASSGSELRVRVASERAKDFFRTDLADHFRIEEELLMPILSDIDSKGLAKRTLDEHAQLRTLVGAMGLGNAEVIGAFGKCLVDHVRFEERELFPMLENLLQMYLDNNA